MRSLKVLILEYIIGFSGIILPTRKPIGLISATITPFKVGTISPFYFSIDATEDYPFYLIISVFDEISGKDKALYTDCFSTKTSYTYRYGNEYTRSTNHVTLRYRLGKEGEFTTITKDVDTSSPQIFFCENKNFKSSCRYLSYERTTGWTYKYESLEFKNFYEFYIPDYYHKLDLNPFIISQKPTLSTGLLYSDAKLVVSNSEGGFNSISENKNAFTINLIVKESSKGSYVLDYGEDLYVNQYTLEMSKTSQEGYVKTKYLYFPKNEMRYQENYSLSIILSGVGIDRNTYIYNFEFKALINTLGDCHNSEYCVVSDL